MSDKNLRKAVNCLEQKIDEVQHSKTPSLIILADSKGKYLKRAIFPTDRFITNEISWCCKGGATIRDSYNYVKRNLKTAKSAINRVVYVWLGTCDLTKKLDNGEITLNSYHSSSVDCIVTQYRELSQFFKAKECAVVFLEIPYFSIKIWNVRKGHHQLDKYIEEDLILKSQIERLNEEIKCLNGENKVQAPLFNKDLQKARSHNGTAQYYTNWAQFTDGIHPGSLVSRVWLLKIILNHYRSS